MGILPLGSASAGDVTSRGHSSASLQLGLWVARASCPCFRPHTGETPVPPNQQNQTLPGARLWAILARGALALAVVLASSRFLSADTPRLRGPDPLRATTSKTARLSALRSIPLDQLDAEGKAKVHSVLSKLSVFRRMPIRVIDCDPNLYLFLVRHPDVVVNIWEVLKMTNLQLQQLDDNTYRLTEPDGTQADLEFLYRSPDLHVVYGEGVYDGPLFAKPVRGRCLMLLATGYVRETDGRYYLTNRLDTFLAVEHGGAELLTKTLHPLLGRTADDNFVQTLAFLGSLSRTAEVNGRGVRRLAIRLEHVQAGLRARLAQLATDIANHSAEATAGGSEKRVAWDREPVLETSHSRVAPSRPTDLN